MSISNPTDISNCLVWLSADYGTGANQVGDGVSTWLDRSGNGNNATQATSGYQPTYRVNAFDAAPAVRFDGVDDFLATPSLTFGGIGMTIAMVLKPLSQRATVERIAQVTADITAAGVNSWELWRGGGGPLYANEITYNAGPAPYNGWRIKVPSYTPAIILVRTDRSLSQAAEIEMYLNGVLSTSPISTAGVTGNWSSGALYLGGVPSANTNGYLWGNFDLAEVVVYSRRVTNAERDDLNAYLARWTTSTLGGSANEQWQVYLRGMQNEWQRRYSPSNPGGIDAIEAVVDRHGNCSRATLTGIWGLAPEYPCVAEIWLEGRRVFMGVIVRAPARYPGAGSYEIEGLRWLQDRAIIQQSWSASGSGSKTSVRSLASGYGSPLVTVPSSFSSANSMVGSVSGSLGDTVGSAIDQIASKSGNVWGVDADGLMFYRPASSITQTIHAPPAIRQFTDNDFGAVITQAVIWTTIDGTDYVINTISSDGNLFGGLQTAVKVDNVSTSRTTTANVSNVSCYDSGVLDAVRTFPFQIHQTASVRYTDLTATMVAVSLLSFTLSGTRSEKGGPNGDYQYQYVFSYTITTGIETLTGSLAITDESASTTITLSRPYTGTVTIAITITMTTVGAFGLPLIDIDKRGSIGLSTTAINSAFTALAATIGQAALSPPTTDINVVTAPGYLEVTDYVTVLSDVEPRSVTATVTEVAYRCSTTEGTSTVLSLGAPLRPIAARQIVRLTESIINNPYRRR